MYSFNFCEDYIVDLNQQNIIGPSDHPANVARVSNDSKYLRLRNHQSTKIDLQNYTSREKKPFKKYAPLTC